MCVTGTGSALCTPGPVIVMFLVLRNSETYLISHTDYCGTCIVHLWLDHLDESWFSTCEISELAAINILFVYGSKCWLIFLSCCPHNLVVTKE